MKKLLQDKTTGQNIIWATEEKGIKPITELDINKIKPRLEKDTDEKKRRTKDKAEVFTPIKIIKTMTDSIDKELKRETKTWEGYINKKILEITCGEGPFITTRYDTTTGERINLSNRIGMLDRKLQLINKHTITKEEWIRWTKQAYKNIYGYEWQGDNLFIARKNAFLTFIENYQHKFKEKPSTQLTDEIINIIVWNIWQMDGLKHCIPLIREEEQQLSLLDTKTYTKPIYCKIKDWENNKIVKFKDIGKGGI